MRTTNATTARADLFRLIDRVNDEAQPVTITTPRGNAVLIGERDWHAIQETLYLASIPGFTETVMRARRDGLDGTSDTLPW